MCIRDRYSIVTDEAYAIIRYDTRNGTANAAHTNFLPNMSAMNPVGRAPANAPTASSDPTHDPCSSVTVRVPFPDKEVKYGRAGEVHASAVPAANADRFAVVKYNIVSSKQIKSVIPL